MKDKIQREPWRPLAHDNRIKPGAWMDMRERNPEHGVRRLNEFPKQIRSSRARIAVLTTAMLSVTRLIRFLGLNVSVEYRLGYPKVEASAEAAQVEQLKLMVRDVQPDLKRQQETTD